MHRHEAELLRDVEDIDTAPPSVVNDIGLMRRLVGAYTRSQITKSALYLDRLVAADYYDDVFGHRDAHYKKLAAMWGGDRNVLLFSPMDALTCPNEDASISNEAFDGAVASIIVGLPGNGVNWRKALTYAIQRLRTHDIIASLCDRGAFFGDDEREAALRMLACETPVVVLDSVLPSLELNGHGDFISTLVALNNATNDSGSALHLCCSSPGPDINERIMEFVWFGVNPTLLSSVSNLRAADMLAMHPRPETRVAMMKLTSRGAGPIRHHMRELGKLTSRWPVGLAESVARIAFQTMQHAAARGSQLQ
jgi:hypothetical protein